jgi:coniferyl-aldehyde dehydrogenase
MNFGATMTRTASDNLAPVTQEHRGKSPAIVERGSSLRRAAQSIAFGKLANAGQTGIAPDYVLVAEEELHDFVTAFVSAAAKLYPSIATNVDYAAIIDDQHYSRLRNMVEDARAKGARLWEVGAAGGTPKRSHPRTFLPVVATGVTEEMALSTEEIFGPILPVIPYRTLEQAIAYLNARPRPPVLCFFGSDGPALAHVLERTMSGNVTINDTLLHFVRGDLPLGGIESSETGAGHGHDGFKAMSLAKGVFVQSDPDTTRAILPPFGKLFGQAVRLTAGASEER